MEPSKLIVSPHVDDEVLGCGGMLNSDCFVYFCGVDETLVASDPTHRIPKENRLAELKGVAAYLGFTYEINREAKVNHFVLTDFISKMEAVINNVEPEFVFLPHPGYNQDHRTIYSACQVALRNHDKNHFVPKVLVYEAIHDFLWSHEKFEPNYFIPIDIERKLHAYRLHRSQVRTFRSMDMLTHLAALRGAMANVAYAEAFTVLRWVEGQVGAS